MLTVAVTVIGPLTTLPGLGAVKHKVTVYAPDEAVLLAQELTWICVGVDASLRVGDSTINVCA